MDKHVTAVAVIHIGFGALGMLAATFVFLAGRETDTSKTSDCSLVTGIRSNDLFQLVVGGFPLAVTSE